MPPISTSSPGFEPGPLQRADHAHPPQPLLDQRLRLLVLEVPAQDQALDGVAGDDPAAVRPAGDRRTSARLGRAEDRELGDLVLARALGLRLGDRHAREQLAAQLGQPESRSRST